MSRAATNVTMSFLHTAPMDYIQVSTIITIESETTGSPICVDATIIDDDVVEREEIFQLILSSMGDEVVLAEPRVANVTILDNDSKDMLQ